MPSEKKTGILTFYNTTNYGALLQMYALYSTLKKEEEEVEIIRYTCKAVEERENISLKNAKTPKQFLRMLILKLPNKRKKKKFEQFERDRLQYSDQIYTSVNISNLKNKYERVVVGSDQIWNFGLTKGDLGFFLVGASDIKKYTYAASFGTETIDEKTAQKIADPLKKFQMISVRETSAIDIVKKTCGINAEFVLDPTFLLTADEWKAVANGETLVEKPYILLYLIQNKRKTIEYAKRLAKINGWSIKYINISPYYIRGVENIRSASPTEFLQLINKASLIITGSYHGLALSINLSKPVYYELSGKQNNYNARISSLINILEMKEYKLDYSLLEVPDINYEKIQSKLSQLRSKSEKVLSLMKE